ncbi:pectate lyase family protein [Sorangium sp. So ce406]|uniref:pectate lyase family protein n=1 Tax=Sorangium sp. So ce406 TaxID=3133311 RepID=UPI003F5C4789
MKQNLFASFLLAVSPLGFALACGTSEPGASGNVDSTAGDDGSTSATTGAAASGGSSAAGSSATGGDPRPGGTGGGGSTGGSGGAAGGDSSAGSGGTGGGGTGGTDGAVDSEGCPLTLEGFASVSGDGQDGTYGGRDGETVTVTTQADLERYARASEPYVIRVQGKITISPKGKEISVASNKTIVGVGATAEISQGGFFLGDGVHNVILRNLTIGDTFVEGDWEGKTQDFDGIQMDTAHHVWIDHCHLHHIGDGMIDSRKDTSYLTVSWSILSDHNKAFGIGWTENLTAQMTIHHNWFRDLNQRNPSTDNVLRAHLYNNWLQRIDSYGNYARGGTNMVLENSVFDTVNRPHYHDDGTLVATGNIYRSTTGTKESSGFTYSFFDPSDFYEYSLDPADELEALLARCAGPRPELGR